MFLRSCTFQAIFFQILCLVTHACFLFSFKRSSNWCYFFLFLAVCNMEEDDPQFSNSQSTVLWEMHTLRRHFSPNIQKSANKLIRDAAKSFPNWNQKKNSVMAFINCQDCYPKNWKYYVYITSQIQNEWTTRLLDLDVSSTELFKTWHRAMNNNEYLKLIWNDIEKLHSSN